MRKFFILIQWVALAAAVGGVGYLLLRPSPRPDYQPDAWRSWDGFAAISYAGISTKGDANSPSEEQVEEQMAALKAAGYHSIRPQDAIAFLHGQAPLPDKAILILFEEGRKETLVQATETICNHGFVATMCIPTRYFKEWSRSYLAPGDIRNMVSSPYWTVGSMGDCAIDDVVVDKNKTSGHFLSSMLWKEKEGVQETPDEFRSRVEQDYAHSAATLAEAAGSPVATYVYPSADAGTGAGASPLAAEINRKALTSHYALAFVAAADSFNPPGSDPFALTRLRARGDWTGNQLVEELQKSGIHTLDPARMAAAETFFRTVATNGRPSPLMGLYVAYARSSHGMTNDVAHLVAAFLDQPPVNPTPGQCEILIKTVGLTISDPAMAPLEARAEKWLSDRSDYAGRLTGLYEKAAAEQRQRGNDQGALQLYQRTLNRDPNRACWADAFDLVETTAGREAAFAWLTNLQQKATSPAISDGMAGLCAEFAGDTNAAAVAYTRSLETMPDQPRLRAFLTRCLLETGRKEDARKQLEQIAEVGRGKAGLTKAELADAWYDVGEPAKATGLDKNLLVHKSQEQVEQGNLDAAAKLAQQAVDSDRDNPEAWKQLGMVLSRLKQTEAAFEALKKASELKPSDTAIWRELGWTLWAQGKKKEAVEAWDKAFGGEVANRDRLLVQIVGRLSEEGDSQLAIELHKRWAPAKSLLSTGMELTDSGRTRGAEPILAKSWDEGDHTPLAGIYTGYVRALNRKYAGTPDYLKPFIASSMSTATPRDITYIIETLKLCGNVPGTVEIVDALAKKLQANPEQSAQLTDLYFLMAANASDNNDADLAFSLYQKALVRDPNRLVWPQAWSLANAPSRGGLGTAMLKSLRERATLPAVKTGLDGKLAELRGDLSSAIGFYSESLKLNPDQPELHQYLFDTSLRAGRLDRASAEVEWMHKRVEQGDESLRSSLADMLSAMGDDAEALKSWQFLHLGNPNVYHYAIEMSLCLYRLGRGNEAVETLKQTTDQAPAPLVYETLVEMLAALGRPGEAAEWAGKGLRFKTTPKLLAYQAEHLETAGSKPEEVLDVAQTALKDIPGSTSVSLIAGRAMAAISATNGSMLITNSAFTVVADGTTSRETNSLSVLDATNAVIAFYENLLARNPAFYPSLIFLRDETAVRNQLNVSMKYAKQILHQRPWDIQLKRRFAASLGERQDFAKALPILREIARNDSTNIIPVLVYQSLTPYDYPGLSTTGHICADLEQLRREGYQLITPAQLDKPRGKQAVIVLVDPVPAVLAAVDVRLQAIRGQAVCIVDADVVQHVVPRQPTPEKLKELEDSGRWQIGISLPTADSAPVRMGGDRVSSLTHRVIANGVRETPGEYASRINAQFDAVAGAFRSGHQRLVFYPSGDYGQASLDTDEATLKTLHEAVVRHFDAALFLDEAGFIMPGYDIARLPAKAVPPSWSTSNLVRHLTHDNAIVRAQVELAKLLYWQGQHEEANYWFHRASESGADPAEIAYNWAANAYQEEDIPTALDRCRRDLLLSPEDAKTTILMDRVNDIRRPEADLYFSGWRDNEGYRYRQWGLTAETPVTDWLRLGALADRDRWYTQAGDHEDATRVGLHGQVFPFEEIWLTGDVWEWLMKDLSNEFGWDARLHMPNRWCGGYLDLVTSREQAETVQAVREEIMDTSYGIETYSRIWDMWDLYLNADLEDRSDGNDTRQLDGQILRRLHDWPYLGIGYIGEAADSTQQSSDYWSPHKLEKHELCAALRGGTDRWHGSMSGGAGYSREETTSWRFIWGARGLLQYDLTHLWNLNGEITYQGGPIYDRTTYRVGIGARW